MFFTDQKLQKRFKEIEPYRYRSVISIKDFLSKEDTQGIVNPAVPTDFSDFEPIHTGDRWAGRDLYLWLHQEIEIPAEWEGKKALGIFDFGKTGDGNNSGFESLLYLNGKPYQGVDANHKEVFFSPSLYGKTVSLTFRFWSGLEGGGIPTPQEHRLNRADLAWLDEKTDHLYYMGIMLLDAIAHRPDDDPVKYTLRSALDEACHCIDWSYPGSAEFYESVSQAWDLLDDKLSAMEKHSLVNVTCVGHTHIDMAWLWRLKNTREKASRSFSTVMRLMEQYPEYIFLQTQPQLYWYVKEDFPELYEEIKQKIKEGRWEADGGMWVEADCNLTSGESLTRQLLLGSRFLREEFGKEPEYLWLPDVFGYSWALPQILKKSGIDMFMTTKISWNQYNRMPHDTFRWKGIDGSEVLTHFITTPTVDSEPGSYFSTYNGQITSKTVKGVWDGYADKELNQNLLISYGFGDGGGGVNRDMLEQRRCVDRIPGLPNVKTGSAGEYFKTLKETVANTDQYVHTWDGELYFEYHRGTYTSHAHNKRMNRKMELLYRRAEWMAVMRGLLKKDLAKAQQERLTQGWLPMLTEQFHDIIPGSSIHDVYEDSKRTYAMVESIGKEVEDGFLKDAVTPSDICYTAINPTAFAMAQTVSVPNHREGVYRDANGEALLSQREGDVTYVSLPSVPSMGMKKLSFTPGDGTEGKTAFTVNGREIETPYYSIRLNQYGQLSRLYDKTFAREVLPEGERANVLQMFEDKPLFNDAWDIDIFYQEKMREITDLVKCEVASIGCLRMVLRLEWNYMNSHISQDMILYANSRRIDFKTDVDFHEQHQLMKAAFPVDVRANFATYDIQYGNARRPNHWNTSWDQARFESVAQKWVDLSERNYGVSLLNDCKYGHDIKGNVIRISLLKSATEPDHLQDQGEHEFTYSLLPHNGDFVDGGTVREALALNDPVFVVPGELDLGYESFLSFDNSQIELDAVKKSEDGSAVILRFHEYAGARQRVTLNLGFAYQSWVESDLMERPIGEASNGAIRMEMGPYEIKTLRLTV